MNATRVSAADGRSLTPELQVVVARVREEVAAVSAELVRAGLLSRVGGVSGRVPGTELFVMTPSGIPSAELGPESTLLCDLQGAVMPNTPGWELSPSADTAAHAYVYRALPDVGGITHTHSPFATAWALRGEPIPCVSTAIAQEFGGPVPVGPFAAIGDESIGRAIVDTLDGARSRAVLLRQHGPFTLGRDAREAAELASAVEDAARTVHLALQAGEVHPLPQDAVDALWQRHTAERDARRARTAR